MRTFGTKFAAMTVINAYLHVKNLPTNPTHPLHNELSKCCSYISTRFIFCFILSGINIYRNSTVSYLARIQPNSWTTYLNVLLSFLDEFSFHFYRMLNASFLLHFITILGWNTTFFACNSLPNTSCSMPYEENCLFWIGHHMWVQQ